MPTITRQQLTSSWGLVVSGPQTGVMVQNQSLAANSLDRVFITFAASLPSPSEAAAVMLRDAGDQAKFDLPAGQNAYARTITSTAITIVIP